MMLYAYVANTDLPNGVKLDSRCNLADSWEAQYAIKVEQNLLVAEWVLKYSLSW